MALKSFTQNMLLLGSGMGLSRAFSKFLDTAISLNSDNNDPLYLRKILIGYSKEDRKLFIETYYSLLDEMISSGSGLNDVLGEFYIRNFNSPARIESQRFCDMLPGIHNCIDPVTRVTDYDCNTGRKFLAAAKFNRNLQFYGMETFYPFFRISLLNLCLNGLFGEIALMKPFNSAFITVCDVGLNYKGKVVIRELVLDDSLLYQKLGCKVPDSGKLVYNF